MSTAKEKTHWGHSVALWTLQMAGPKYKDEDINEVCAMLKRQGIKYVDLAPPHLWDAIYQNGLQVGCALPPMDPDPPFGLTLAHPDPKVVERGSRSIKETVNLCQRRNVRFVIVFTGIAVEGVSIEQAQPKLIEQFIPLAQYAHERGVMLVLEQLNTVDDREMKGHPHYYGEKTPYCAEIVQAVNRKLNRRNGTQDEIYFGLVFDFYHQAKMKEDSLRLIYEYGDLVCYVHTASVPDREFLLPGIGPDYVTLSRALRAKKGDKGKGLIFMQEWMTTSSNLTELEQNISFAVKICESL